MNKGQINNKISPEAWEKARRSIRVIKPKSKLKALEFVKINKYP